MKESFGGSLSNNEFVSNPETRESEERDARRRLGQFALNSDISSLVKNIPETQGEDRDILIDDINGRIDEVQRRIMGLDEDDVDYLWQCVQAREEQLAKMHDEEEKSIISEYGQEYLESIFNELYKKRRLLDNFAVRGEYPEKWLNTRGLLLSTLATPEQNPDKYDKHTKNLANALTNAIIDLDVSEEKISRMSGILTSRHLPDFAKQMAIFQIIHPVEKLDSEFSSSFHHERRTAVDGRGSGKLESPVLKSLVSQQLTNRESNSPAMGEIEAEDGRKYNTEEIIYHDVLKCAFGSSGHNIESFLKRLEECDNFIEGIHTLDKASVVSDYYTREQVQENIDMIETLNSLFFSQMQIGRKEVFENTKLPSVEEAMNGSIEDISREFVRIEELFGVSSRYTLGDRIVRSFCYPLGITGIQSAYTYLQTTRGKATDKNIQLSHNNEMQDRPKGYIFKGVASVDYLPNILEDGILAKEYLGIGEFSDMTPFDTDFATANDINSHYSDEDEKDDEKEPNLSLADALFWSAANSFSGGREGKDGFIIAIKRDQRFQDEYVQGERRVVYSKNKYGIFNTDSYGYDSKTSVTLSVRTGVASTDIDYLIAYDESADKVIKHVINNNFYIPVVDFNGNLLLSFEDWSNSQKSLR